MGLGLAIRQAANGRLLLTTVAPNCAVDRPHSNYGRKPQILDCKKLNPSKTP